MSDHRPSVLVVEDNRLIAADMTIALEACGCRTVGPAYDVAHGIAAVEEDRPDAALLDITLGGDRVWPVAELLDRQGVPFALVTGYGDSDVPERFRHRPLLPKPATVDAIAGVLRRIGLLPT